MWQRKWVIGLWLGLCLATPAWADDLRSTTYYTTQNKTDTSTSAQSGTTLWTPATGKQFALQGCMVSSDKAVTVRLQVSGVDVIPPIYNTSFGTQVVTGGVASLYTSATDAVLTYTTTSESSTYGRVSVMCWGYEDVP